MGAWGVGSFENDDAMDFIAELQAGGISVVRDALQEVAELGTDDYLEAPMASESSSPPTHRLLLERGCVQIVRAGRLDSLDPGQGKEGYVRSSRGEHASREACF